MTDFLMIGRKDIGCNELFYLNDSARELAQIHAHSQWGQSKWDKFPYDSTERSKSYLDNLAYLTQQYDVVILSRTPIEHGLLEVIKKLNGNVKTWGFRNSGISPGEGGLSACMDRWAVDQTHLYEYYNL